MSSQTASRTSRVRLAGVALVAMSLLAACGETAAPSPSLAVATPRPTPTPDTHLTDPAAGAEVYTRLNHAGLGTGRHERVDRQGAAQHVQRHLRRLAALAARVLVGHEPRQGPALPGRRRAQPRAPPPFTFAGQNIVVYWGPIEEGAAPPEPDASQLEAATKLAVALDAVVGPLQERSSSRVSPLTPIAAPAP